MKVLGMQKTKRGVQKKVVGLLAQAVFLENWLCTAS